MNGWMPMLNLAFNDYNMSGENKLLLTMQTKGTVLYGSYVLTHLFCMVHMPFSS